MSSAEKLPPINNNSLALACQEEANFYNVSGSRHYLPSKSSLKPGKDTYSGTIETWPAHATKKLCKSLYPNKKSTKKATKPKFLTALEAYAEKELYLLRASDDNESLDLRLQAYREVFEYLIEDFKTYKPLLSKIKNEYERNLSYLREKAREVEPLKSMLVIVSEKCEKKIEAIRESEQNEIKELLREKIELMKTISRHEENEISLNTQITRLQEELAEEYNRYRNENTMRKMLLADINELKIQEEDLKKITVEADKDVQEDVVTLKIALKAARADLTACSKELNIIKADYNDVIPRRDYDIMKTDRENLVGEMSNLKDQFDILQQEHQALLEAHAEVIEQRDEFYTELSLLKRSATPRPSWELCCDSLTVEPDDWDEMIKDKSSKDILEILMKEFRRDGSAGVFDGRGVTEEIPKVVEVLVEDERKLGDVDEEES